jgi:hypothetical protein
MEPSLDVESWSETLDNASDDLAHMGQITEDEAALRIAQSYIEAEITLHLHLRVRPRRGEDDAYEFCAVVATDKGAIEHIADLRNMLDEAGIPRELARAEAFRASMKHLDWEEFRQGAADVNEAMLVYVVKPRKQGQIRLSRLVSTLKGLDVLDSCPIIRAYATKHPDARLIPLPAFVDGELGLARGASSPQEHELPKEVVQRGPQVVSELPDDEPDTGIGEIAAEAKHVLAGIAVELTDDAAVFLVKEGISFAVERGQVLIRSFESPVDGL